MHWPRISILLTLALAVLANAQSAKVIKVLPHYLDEKGRHTLNASLYERDAYQDQLRKNPAQRSALRFDVQWKAESRDALLLRVEAKGGPGHRTNILERPVKAGTFSQWTSLKLEGAAYEHFGELVSWRATLWQGTNMVGEQKSFLW